MGLARNIAKCRFACRIVEPFADLAALLGNITPIARQLIVVCPHFFLAVAWLVAAGESVTPPPRAPLSLRVSAPAAVKPNEPRDIVATIINDGAAPVLVLPNMVRLQVEGAGAEYVPYPGPPIDPWAGARRLAPGASETVLMRDASDKRGVWRLPRGRYRVIAVYEVPSDLAPPATIADPRQVWRGRLESAPAPVSVD